MQCHNKTIENSVRLDFICKKMLDNHFMFLISLVLMKTQSGRRWHCYLMKNKAWFVICSVNVQFILFFDLVEKQEYSRRSLRFSHSSRWGCICKGDCFVCFELKLKAVTATIHLVWRIRKQCTITLGFFTFNTNHLKSSNYSILFIEVWNVTLHGNFSSGKPHKAIDKRLFLQVPC